MGILECDLYVPGLDHALNTYEQIFFSVHFNFIINLFLLDGKFYIQGFINSVELINCTLPLLTTLSILALREFKLLQTLMHIESCHRKENIAHFESLVFSDYGIVTRRQTLIIGGSAFLSTFHFVHGNSNYLSTGMY